MRLLHLENLRDAYKTRRSPAGRLVDAIYSHSNSAEYLVSNLRAILSAVENDLRDEQKWRASALTTLSHKEHKA